MPTRIEPEKILVVIRHGQTDWNIEERFQGQLDIPLNAAGRDQAELLKRHFAGIRFDVAHSSPLRRAFETARIIAAGIPIHLDERLIEIHHGLWQGKTKRGIADRWPDQWVQWSSEPHRFTPPGAEPVGTVRSRVRDFLATLRGRHILCVSHGIVIQTLVSLLVDDPRIEHDAYVPANGSVHTFFFRNDKICDYRIGESAERPLPEGEGLP